MFTLSPYLKWIVLNVGKDSQVILLCANFLLITQWYSNTLKSQNITSKKRFYDEIMLNFASLVFKMVQPEKKYNLRKITLHSPFIDLSLRLGKKSFHDIIPHWHYLQFNHAKSLSWRWCEILTSPWPIILAQAHSRSLCQLAVSASSRAA